METTVPVVLSILAGLLILSLARLGVLFGVFYELTSSVLLFFAMMVTLRYWYEAAQWVESVMPGAGAYGAFGAYWALFLVGCVPLILVLNRVTYQAVPRYPRFVDAALGAVFGLIAAIILVCCVFTSLSVIGPKIWEPYNHDALTVAFDRYPIMTYQYIEEQWLRIPKTNADGTPNPCHTRFSTFENKDADSFQTYWR
jgi:uncharacterized membrane protein required for colicin V production